jgi:hypothetical protein
MQPPWIKSAHEEADITRSSASASRGRGGLARGAGSRVSVGASGRSRGRFVPPSMRPQNLLRSGSPFVPASTSALSILSPSLPGSLAPLHPSPDREKEVSPPCPDLDYPGPMDIDMPQDIPQADEDDMLLHMQAPLIEDLHQASRENIIFKSNKRVRIVLTLILQNRTELH